MRAIRVHESGGIDTMRLDEIPRPVPGAGEVLVAVKAAGVGPWDRLIREGESGLGQALPLTLGSDISGTMTALGADVDVFALGDAVYGATNDLFVGGCSLRQRGHLIRRRIDSGVGQPEQRALGLRQSIRQSLRRSRLRSLAYPPRFN